MESMTFVLFGATGDLAKRKIYPALYKLFSNGNIPQSISIIGIGRRVMSDVEFQTKVEQSLATFSRRSTDDELGVEEFISTFRYCQLNTANIEDYQDLLSLVKRRETELNMPENRMFYLSVIPEVFDVIALNIKEIGLWATKGLNRLIIEKPFGHHVTSAHEFNEKLIEDFDETDIFYIDHYL
ncbi:glucose-6-phosphate dehydrogenase [Bacillus thuringiensis serovar brasilensis]|uniref:glucose-6-phosphate dehydrogenase n=1 Tax=Bacillus cereus group TaxID=86661 RepID=UPI000A3D2676|nr:MULTISPECIES: glucose-6-phosphate dehydrogenase [Bacillus cereus group]MRA71645.1 glucose-6-phosphate dehydrogenase [Bacillus thuringiensis]MCU5029559.1 glucose-6-phosphate dehydrogenase [Bacillus cereus]MRA89605.1 glucose-6-phosphate dehydrogenase [Bacillus thuringiensis]MRC52071.1 glucose-6-phosphate dehydrogenase [Bacillus thuringiensis]OTX27975.1 glucose-6-phosphate dehydrogenase [Bacillus thuringiensis serovar brasilensis]